MPLPVGTRLGAYEILAPIGAGGMGEVYRAKDARLSRDVALKVLPEEFFEDADRVARFEREAKSLAALNHPGIAAVHSFEEISGRHILVMELVEGEGLDEKIASGPLPLEEALAYARQIAEALEAAHEKGIVHRDLKPANVRVTPDGKVKLLDFGLAKIFEADPTGSSPSATRSPTLTGRATAAGMILGTAAYMSPEQARGKALDKRTDVWAFGCVLYEMLTGKRAFEGETVSDTLAAVLMKEPNWEALPPQMPAGVGRVLRKCLQRDVKLRLRDIGDARLDLDDAGASPTASSSHTAAQSGATAGGRGGRKLLLAWGTAAALAAVAVALAMRARAPGAAPVVRLSIPLAPGQILSAGSMPAISRDGRTIAYGARDASGVARLYVRGLDRYDPTVIPDSEGAQQPFFSPDGNRVGFFARGKLMTAAVSGGAPTAIADASSQPFGATWGEDDTIVFVPSLMTGLLRISSSGDKPRNLTEPDDAVGGYGHVWPQFLPGGRSLLFTIWGGTDPAANKGAALLSLDTGKWTTVAAGLQSFRYASSGHLLQSDPRGVMAVAFDPAHPQPVRFQTFVIDDVFQTSSASISWFAMSETGTLVYVPGDPILSTMAWVDRQGRVTPLADQPTSVVDPTLSPDGTRVVLEDKDSALWVVDLRRGSRSRLTLDHEGSNAYPVWSRDGSRVFFGSNRGGDWDLYEVPASGGPAKRLLARRGNQFPQSEAPDGTLLFTERTKGGADLLTLSPDGTVKPFIVSPSGKFSAQFSPDGRTVAYVSDETGSDEVYVRPVARPGEVVAVSAGGGREPRWSPDGREIFYRRADAFFATSVSATGPLSVGDSKKLFEMQAAFGRSQMHGGYDVSSDGGRFFVLLLDRRAIPTQINVVLTWFEELKAKVGKP
jgi:Tol biopolymer transport system component